MTNAILSKSLLHYQGTLVNMTTRLEVPICSNLARVNTPVKPLTSLADISMIAFTRVPYSLWHFRRPFPSHSVRIQETFRGYDPGWQEIAIHNQWPPRWSCSSLRPKWGRGCKPYGLHDQQHLAYYVRVHKFWAEMKRLWGVVNFSNTFVCCVSFKIKF